MTEKSEEYFIGAKSDSVITVDNSDIVNFDGSDLTISLVPSVKPAGTRTELRPAKGDDSEITINSGCKPFAVFYEWQRNFLLVSKSLKTKNLCHSLENFADVICKFPQGVYPYTFGNLSRYHVYASTVVFEDSNFETWRMGDFTIYLSRHETHPDAGQECYMPISKEVVFRSKGDFADDMRRPPFTSIQVPRKLVLSESPPLIFNFDSQITLFHSTIVSSVETKKNPGMIFDSRPVDVVSMEL